MQNAQSPSLEGDAAGVLTIGLPQNPSSYRRTGVRIARPSQTLLDSERADR